MSVLLNSKDAALNQEFQNNGQTNANQCFLELQRTLVGYIRAMPGNEKCCDCDSTNGKLPTTLIPLLLSLSLSTRNVCISVFLFVGIFKILYLFDFINFIVCTKIEPNTFV